MSGLLFWALWIALIFDALGWLWRSVQSDPKYRTYSQSTLLAGGLLSAVFVVWLAIERW